ncbi:MAG: PHP domain-containing protein [Dehalococcoidia bacterium]
MADSPTDPRVSALFGRADLQVHTSFGDGMDDARTIFERVEREAFLDVIAITDHDDVRGALEAREAFERTRERWGFELVTGIEVTTAHGHLLALWVDRPIPSFKPLERTVAMIHEAGGVAVVPHPFSFLTRSIGRRTLERVLALPAEQRPDGIEVASPLSKGWHAGERARRDNLAHWRLAETGGSDAHFVETVGLAYTRFPGRTSDALRAAVEARTTEGVLQGPTPYREIGPARLARQQVRGLAVTPRKVLGPKVRALREQVSARIATRR